MIYSTNQVAQRLGITVYTLHYYDKQGLLPFVERDKNGTRIFKDSDFKWLDTIMALKNTGMTLKNIKQYVKWVIEGDATLTQRLECIKNQKKSVEKQMADLKKYLELLDYKQWYYETAIEAGTAAIHEQVDCGTDRRPVPEIYTTP
jgi:DNA-binding transcriptional MerR regulator